MSIKLFYWFILSLNAATWFVELFLIPKILSFLHNSFLFLFNMFFQGWVSLLFIIFLFPLVIFWEYFCLGNGLLSI